MQRHGQHLALGNAMGNMKKLALGNAMGNMKKLALGNAMGRGGRRGARIT